MTFDEYLAEQSLSSLAAHHFSKAAKHAEGSVYWHKHNARGHGVLSQHYDKHNMPDKAREHHDLSEKHISALEKIQDRKDGY